MSACPDRRLWCAVLTHALPFAAVCALAGLDPQAVAERVDPERFRALIRAA